MYKITNYLVKWMCGFLKESGQYYTSTTNLKLQIFKKFFLARRIYKEVSIFI